MALSCPHCGHSISIKDVKAGSYKPKCPKCTERFALTVSDDPSVPPVASKIVSAPASATVAEATMAPSATMASKPAAPPAEATSLNATVVNATFSAGSGSASVTKPGIQATIPSRGADVTAAGNSQATRVEPFAGSGPGSHIPAVLGGYRILRELGRGAMGSVYLANQISLDRNVALKTIQAQWADNPTFVARFTREAYAAAQLSHHNVVQIYDLGTSNDINFFSMEYVQGESLDDLIKRDGKLDVEVAVGYVLQAARGLQFAHNHGMVHRDVKPANLILSNQGIVKVADLGLVKTPQLSEGEGAASSAAPAINAGMSGSLAAARADVTLANVAMGTPAYMAPEQGTNAAGVDHRADIYSLGCTLYVLLTGRPPFEGATAMEVITKHKTEPVVRPEAIVKRVPPALSEITLKMVAKSPEDRYANLGEVIAALEGFLGIQSSGSFSPKEEHAQALEESLAQFNSASGAKLRAFAPMAFVAGTLALMVILFAMGNMSLAGSLVAMLFSATATYFVVSGTRDRTPLFERSRAYLFTARISDWLTWGASGLLLVMALYLAGWLLAWSVMAFLGVGLGMAFYFFVDGHLKSERRPAIEKAEKLFRTLRLLGIDEGALRQFVVRYSGEQWEEYFETLFGYDAKITARDKLTGSGKPRAKFRAWRDPLIRYFNSRLQLQQEERDRLHLQQVEEKGLQAIGVDVVEARKQAQHMAAALLDEAADAREAIKAGKPPVFKDPAIIAAEKRERTKQLLADARRGAYQAKRQRLIGIAFSPLTFALGGKVRFLAGALLLVCFGLWAKQNQIFDTKQVADLKSSAQSAIDQQDTEAAKAAAKVAAEQVTQDLWSRASNAQPLPIPVIGNLVSGFPALAAGLTLLILGLFGGWRMSLFAIPAAVLMLLMPIPGGWQLNLGIGGALAVIGFFFGRTYDD